MNKKNDEIERRVNMKLMATQLADIHEEIFNKEDGLCRRVTKLERMIWIASGGACVIIFLIKEFVK